MHNSMIPSKRTEWDDYTSVKTCCWLRVVPRAHEFTGYLSPVMLKAEKVQTVKENPQTILQMVGIQASVL